MDSSPSSPLFRQNNNSCATVVDNDNASLLSSSPQTPKTYHQNNKHRQRRKRPSNIRRTNPPSQDRLVIVFITASAIFAMISITPFLLGHFPTHDETNQELKGLMNTAENRWERLVKELNKDIVQHDDNKSYSEQHQSDVTEHSSSSLPLARGVAGLPMSQTPALIGAKHGSIQCGGQNFDDLAYWNDPQGELDTNFVSPFAPTDKNEKKYITFEPDRGGWNNIRMALEIVVVFAAATGRILGFVPELQAGNDCLIFDKEHQAAKSEYNDEELFDLLPEEEQAKISKFCNKRKPTFFGGNELEQVQLIHFQGGEKYHRLLSHFYSFLYFVDDKIDHHYKRFVRDFMHYRDNIYCAAGKVIRALEEEAAKAGGNGFSAMHVRRGDFQYKKVKITAEDWYVNTKDLFLDPKEIIYIATDEKDHKFFEPLAQHYNLRFLDDFKEVAKLDEMDPNLFGMIDTVIASRGRVFVGTWFSTFTGYINRMRGYRGLSGTTSYYSTPDRKYNTHEWADPEKIIIAREWPTAWVGIDGDVAIHSETGTS
ncbi:hypothetical protein ACHAWC_010805 [Mediolabrus comicus]